MTMPKRLSRYLLLEDLNVGRAQVDPSVTFWRGHDEVLDREVSLRGVRADDPRSAGFLKAAQSAALVDDRRLLRILDILTVPANSTQEKMIVVVSEWAVGRNLAQIVVEREGPTDTYSPAISLAADIAGAISSAQVIKVNHGRLRPSSVIVTDAGEVRLRGLSVDASVLGPLNPMITGAAADVEGLGYLLYFMVTGLWPGPSIVGLPDAPRINGQVLPPSHVRAEVPHLIDEAIGRTLGTGVRFRGMSKISSAAAFRSMLGVTRDRLTPMNSSIQHRLPQALTHTWMRRLGGIMLGFALVVGVGVLGWSLINRETGQTTKPSLNVTGYG